MLNVDEPATGAQASHKEKHKEIQVRSGWCVVIGGEVIDATGVVVRRLVDAENRNALNGAGPKAAPPPGSPQPNSHIAQAVRDRIAADPVSAYSRVLGGEQFVREGREFKFRCRRHDDHDPSARLNPEKAVWFCDPCDAGGDLFNLYQLMHGCDFPTALRELVDLLGLASKENAHDGSAGSHVVKNKTKDGPVTCHRIKNVDGTLAAVHCRQYYRLADGKRDKKMWWTRPDGTNGLGGILCEDLPLYLSETISTMSKDKRGIVVTEGEVAAMAVHQKGKVPAVGTVTGAGGCPSDEVLRVLVPYEPILFPDNHKEGREHMAKVARGLARLGRTCWIVDSSNLPPGGDAADFEGTKEEFLAMLSAATPYDPGPEPNKKEPKAKVRVGPYEEMPGGLYHVKLVPMPDGSPPKESRTQLTNFRARVVSEIERDDGVEITHHFEIHAEIAQTARNFTIPVAEFLKMTWPVEYAGVGAVIFAGASTRDHARAAIQLLSQDAPKRTVYTHTGWREVDGKMVYLHAGGALGANGPIDNVVVDVPEKLRPLHLALPGDADALRASIDAELALLEAGPVRVTATTIGAVLATLVGETHFTVHLAGRGGVYKTGWAMILLKHMGASFEVPHLLSWDSSAGFLQTYAFIAKNSPLVIDDFVPGENRFEQFQAQRVIRASGNASGRGRLTRNADLRESKAPRGLIISTGEEVSRGYSGRTRQIVFMIAKGDFNLDTIIAHHTNGTNGLYVRSTAAFIRWLAPRIKDLQSKQHKPDSSRSNDHARTPSNIEAIRFAWSLYLDFATELGALSPARRLECEAKVEAGLNISLNEQTGQQAEERPELRYLEFLRSAISSGLAHVAAGTETILNENEEPPEPDVWGWRAHTVFSHADGRDKTEWRPQGQRIGFVDGNDLYLDPVAAFRAGNAAASSPGERLTLDSRALNRRLHEAGLLASTELETRETYTIRKRIRGQDLKLLHLKTDTFWGASDNDQKPE